MRKALPPGTVGILTSDLTRYAWFHQSVLALQLPSGTTIDWAQGHWISVAINMLIRQMEGEWICLLADDHILPPDLLPRLLAHDKPIVAPLCALRRLPFKPSMFRASPQGSVGYEWQELEGKSGLLPVDTMGGPGVVIRREVLEKIGDPWFQNMPGQKETPCEDVYFFQRCRELGYQPYVDLDLPIAHITPMALYPHRAADAGYQIRVWDHEDVALLTPYERKEPV